MAERKKNVKNCIKDMDNNKRKILISICTPEEFKKNLLDGFRRAEAGIRPREPIHALYFTSETDLFSTLSPKRMELLRFLRKSGPSSCRKLAAKLGRSYANVHGDVQELMKLDLIQKDEEQKLFVPWSELDLAIPLAA